MPPALLRAIETAAAKDPGDRWPSAGAFVTALQKTVDVRPYDVRESKRHAVRSRVGWAGVAAGTLAAAAGFGWFVGQEPVSSRAPAPVTAPERPPDAREIPATVPQDLNVPPVDSTSTRVGPTRPAVQPVRASAQQEPVRPIDVVTPPEAPAANTNAQPSSVAQPSTAAADAAPSQISETITPSVTPPATPAPADVITPPTRIRTVTPDYPDIARAAELEGDVLLQATVGTDGRISNVQVLRAVHPVLDEAARRAVLQYEYTPGQRNGIPEAATVRITVSFRLR